MAHLTRSGVAAAVAATLGCSLGAHAAFAQTNDTSNAATNDETSTAASGGLQEITVTSERFSATVQTTPVAVTALSPEILTERKVTSVQEVSSQIPGIVITPSTGSSNSARIVLRGAGQEQGGINFDPAVGIYIDGVYQPRINGSFFDFFDIQRLEVLRGPQGTLYGRNTSGGAIKIETRRPSYEWTGSAELAAGQWDTRDAKGYLSGPIIADKLAFSVSGVSRNRDGFIDGPAYGRRVGDMDRKAERVKLLYTPTDSFEATLSAYAMQDYSDPGVGVPLQVGPGVVDPLANGTFNRDLTTTEVFGTMGQSLNNSGASLNASYTVSPNLTLNSISGYGNLRTHGTGSILWITAAAQQSGNGDLNLGAGGDGRSRDEFWSQEFNATYTSDAFKGVAGLYYFDERGESNQIRGGTPNDQIRKTKAYAAFAQGTYQLGHGVGLTAGLRWTKEDADFTQFYYTLVNFEQSLTDSFKGTTPKLGINWQITDDVLTYLTWTKGFKSGGINPVPPNANTGVVGQLGAPVAYGPEKVDSYELGTKFQTPDRRLRLNVALFEAKYKGLQLPVFFPGTSTSYTSNASGATIYGLEFEPTWQVLDSLQLYGNAAWTHGKYTEPFICSGQFGAFRDCSDNKIKGVIPGKEMLGFMWTLPLSLPGEFRLQGQWNHTGHYYNNVANEGPLVQTVPVSIYDASISWTDPDERWRIALDGKNLANKHYVLAGLQLANPTQPSVTGYINDPRVVLLRATVNFK